MEVVCEQMKTIMDSFATTVEGLHTFRQAAAGQGMPIILPEMPINTSLPSPDFVPPDAIHEPFHPRSSEAPPITACLPPTQYNEICSSKPRRPENEEYDDGEDGDDDGGGGGGDVGDNEDEDEHLPDDTEKAAPDHIITVDSYGKPRFVYILITTVTSS